MIAGPLNTSLFVFGSLMDADILHIVSGMASNRLTIQKATLAGFRQCEVIEECYPVLVENPGSITRGLIIDGLTEQAMTRIHFFEGDEYRLQSIEVSTTFDEKIDARFFSHTGAYSVKDTSWNFQQWLDEQKDEFVVRTQNYMKLFGTMNATEADQYW